MFFCAYCKNNSFTLICPHCHRWNQRLDNGIYVRYEDLDILDQKKLLKNRVEHGNKLESQDLELLPDYIDEDSYEEAKKQETTEIAIRLTAIDRILKVILENNNLDDYLNYVHIKANIYSRQKDNEKEFESIMEIVTLQIFLHRHLDSFYFLKIKERKKSCNEYIKFMLKKFNISEHEDDFIFWFNLEFHWQNFLWSLRSKKFSDLISFIEETLEENNTIKITDLSIRLRDIPDLHELIRKTNPLLLEKIYKKASKTY